MKSILPYPERRRARRIDYSLDVTFQVNGGPKLASDTFNFTHRSLGIRTDCAVVEGDHVAAFFEEFPVLTGRVVRVFEEGFAIRLDEATMTLIALANARCPTLGGANAHIAANAARIFSPFFRLDAAAPSWARFATSQHGYRQTHRHYLTMLTTAAISPKDIRNVWFCANQSNWVARLLRSRRRGSQMLFVLLLNDWQIQLASEFGFSINIITTGYHESHFSAPASAVAEHLTVIANSNTDLVKPDAPQSSQDVRAWLDLAPPAV